MLSHLKEQKAIGIDVEHHSYRSYQGITSLIQISSQERDFLIDPFPLWETMIQLNEVTTNPNILKILHGGNSDVLWL
jgi:exosome complex exonuclease RRP6